MRGVGLDSMAFRYRIAKPRPLTIQAGKSETVNQSCRHPWGEFPSAQVMSMPRCPHLSVALVDLATESPARTAA
jgi:hypothetical protein